MKNNATLHLEQAIMVENTPRDEVRCYIESFDDHGIRIEVQTGRLPLRFFIPHRRIAYIEVDGDG